VEASEVEVDAVAVAVVDPEVEVDPQAVLLLLPKLLLSDESSTTLSNATSTSNLRSDLPAVAVVEAVVEEAAVEASAVEVNAADAADLQAVLHLLQKLLPSDENSRMTSSSATLISTNLIDWVPRNNNARTSYDSHVY